MGILVWIIIGVAVIAVAAGIIVAFGKGNQKSQSVIKPTEITSADVQAIKIIRELAEIYKNV